ncbi:hypothetical protein R1sor_023557 [Riccia sorocarpa]|uniref:Uncharacterized protein n=1 Tax=Riccia sorocarpa TaxID=122646 RepID=A0ABD3GPI7_9MARC
MLRRNEDFPPDHCFTYVKGFRLPTSRRRCQAFWKVSDKFGGILFLIFAALKGGTSQHPGGNTSRSLWNQVVDAVNVTGGFFHDSGFADTQPTDYGWCPRTQTFLREAYRPPRKFFPHRHRHVNNPPRVESSSAPPSRTGDQQPDSPSTPVQGVSAPAGSRSRSGIATAEASSRANSGVKRKKEASRSAALLVDAIDRMSQSATENMREVELGRIQREQQRQQHLLQLETMRQDRADRRARAMVDVLRAMVIVIEDLAKAKRARQ